MKKWRDLLQSLPVDTSSCSSLFTHLAAPTDGGNAGGGGGDGALTARVASIVIIPVWTLRSAEQQIDNWFSMPSQLGMPHQGEPNP